MSRKLLLGCIADDFTGASDLANNLVRAGMRVVQTIGVPEQAIDDEVDAVVIALKSRTNPVDQAIAMSLEALQWLQKQGAKQIYFKYCSTFDSTATGNIGPVAQALMQALNTSFTVATPAFPDAARTVFKGYLFVGDVLLNESGMRNHPLTPMTDANLVRVLQAQTTKKVGLIDYKAVAAGEQAVRAKIDQLKANGVGMAIIDAVSNDDLINMAGALSDLPLLTGGSGLAIGLPANFGISPSDAAAQLPKAKGLQAIVSGSCSVATNQQVANFKASGKPVYALDPLLMFDNKEACINAVLAWAKPLVEQGPVLVYSTGKPESVKKVQEQLGVEQAGQFVESCLATIAQGLVKLGVQQLIVAGGETSGACVQALGIEQLRIGTQISAGVPWCYAHSSISNDFLHITLKSGNFGGDDFFLNAWEYLDK